jgi:hypothetical protein
MHAAVFFVWPGCSTSMRSAGNGESGKRRELTATYNPMTVASLQSAAPGISWQRFLSASGVPSAASIAVAEKSAIVGITCPRNNACTFGSMAGDIQVTTLCQRPIVWWAQYTHCRLFWSRRLNADRIVSTNPRNR